MIGALFSFLALAPAVLVARREPSYRPIRDSLAASFLHAALAGADLADRDRLVLFAAVPLASLIAYAATWGDRVDRAVTWLIAMSAAGWIAFAPQPAAWWEALTIGPIALSVVAGAGLLWSSRRALDISSAVCALILATDAATCLAWRLGAVAAWQGRAQAVLVALLEAAYLIRAKRQQSM